MAATAATTAAATASPLGGRSLDPVAEQWNLTIGLTILSCSSDEGEALAASAHSQSCRTGR